MLNAILGDSISSFAMMNEMNENKSKIQRYALIWAINLI